MKCLVMFPLIKNDWQIARATLYMRVKLDSARKENLETFIYNFLILQLQNAGCNMLKQDNLLRMFWLYNTT